MKAKILLIENNDNTKKLLDEIITPSIVQIDLVRNADLAIQYLEIKKYDLLIITDSISQRHGLNVSKHTSSQYPWTRIMIISSVLEGFEYRMQALSQYKAHEFLEKPYARDNFKKAIYRLLNIKVDLEGIEKKKKLTSTDLFAGLIEEQRRQIPEYVFSLMDEDTAINFPKKPGSDAWPTGQEPGAVQVKFTHHSPVAAKHPALHSVQAVNKKIEANIHVKLQNTLRELGLEKKSSLSKTTRTESLHPKISADKTNPVIKDR